MADTLVLAHMTHWAWQKLIMARAPQTPRSVISVCLGLVLACTAPIGHTVKAADTAESSDKEITIRFLEPGEIEAVKALIKAGDLDDALQRADAVETPRYRIIALGYVAETFAKRGEIGKAEAIGLSLTISAQRDWVLVYAVMGAVSHYADAETTDRLINAMSAPVARTRALCFVALGQLVRGQRADAEYTTLRAASEAQQIIAPNDVAEMNGWITALSGELGRPSGLEDAIESPSWFGVPSAAYFIAATSSAEMLDMITRARVSLTSGSTRK